MYVIATEQISSSIPFDERRWVQPMFDGGKNEVQLYRASENARYPVIKLLVYPEVSRGQTLRQFAEAGVLANIMDKVSHHKCQTEEESAAWDNNLKEYRADWFRGLFDTDEYLHAAEVGLDLTTRDPFVLEVVWEGWEDCQHDGWVVEDLAEDLAKGLVLASPHNIVETIVTARRVVRIEWPLKSSDDLDYRLANWNSAIDVYSRKALERVMKGIAGA